ncbi:hypothetical protein, partial [Thiolapillus sp.]
VVRACGWITMALCFLQVLREPVVQYLAGSEQRIAPFVSNPPDFRCRWGRNFSLAVIDHLFV